MTLPAFAFIFLLGSLFGASLMLLAVARAMNLMSLQREAREYWFRHYLVANTKAVERQRRLDEIHEQHVRAGKQRHRNERERILAKAAEMQADMNNSRKPSLKVAA